MRDIHHKGWWVKGIHRQTHTVRGGVKALGIEFSHHLHSLFAGLDSADLLQIRHDGFITHLVAAHAVHVETIERTDLLSVAALWQILLVGILHDQRIDAQFVRLFQIDESTVHRVLLVNRVVLQPVAYGILPEIVTRFHTLIKIRSKVLCRTCHTHEGEGYGNHQFFHFMNSFSKYITLQCVKIQQIFLKNHVFLHHEHSCSW